MDLIGLFEHFLKDHDIHWGTEGEDDDLSTFEEWVEAYNKAVNYDPDTIKNEEEDIHQSSDSSSESSSEDESKPWKQKKRQRLKESDKLKKQVSDVIDKVENNHQYTNIKLEQRMTK